jgi:hypothetical protein
MTIGDVIQACQANKEKTSQRNERMRRTLSGCQGGRDLDAVNATEGHCTDTSRPPGRGVSHHRRWIISPSDTNKQRRASAF